MLDIDKEFPEYDFSHCKKISRAPLHEACPSTCNVKPAKLRKLLKAGHEIVRGKFTSSEDKRLKKNWKRICRCYPEYADPFYAFGFTYRPENCEYQRRDKNDKEYLKIRRAYKENLRVMFHMAFKLNNRLICDIYLRCRKLFCYSQFPLAGAQELETEDYELLHEQLQEEDRKEVCSSTGISPEVAQIIKRRKFGVKKMFWKPQDDLMLEASIERQINNADPKTYPIYKIDWDKVVYEMKTCGYDLVKDQLYRRWSTLHPHLKNLKNAKLKRLTSADWQQEER